MDSASTRGSSLRGEGIFRVNADRTATLILGHEFHVNNQGKEILGTRREVRETPAIPGQYDPLNPYAQLRSYNRIQPNSGVVHVAMPALLQIAAATPYPDSAAQPPSYAEATRASIDSVDDNSHQPLSAPMMESIRRLLTACTARQQDTENTDAAVNPLTRLETATAASPRTTPGTGIRIAITDSDNLSAIRPVPDIEGTSTSLGRLNIDDSHSLAAPEVADAPYTSTDLRQDLAAWINEAQGNSIVDPIKRTID